VILSSEGDRLLHSRRHGEDEKRCVGKGAEERLQDRDPDQHVEVDQRGYIYAVDRANTGMHILRLTGAAREAMK